MKKIVLIDDEIELCRTIKMNLEDTGEYQVVTETDGKVALSVIKSHNPDLVILDCIMPEIDGSEIAIKMRNDPQTQNIPIIFLTAIATKEETKRQNAIIGGQYVVAKPVSVQELIEHIEKNLK